MLELIEALAGRTAGRHEGHEGLGGAADEPIGVIVGRNGQEAEPLVYVVNVRVGAVPVDGDGLGVEALGPERVGLADHDHTPTEYATRRNDRPGENSRGRKRTMAGLPVAN